MYWAFSWILKQGFGCQEEMIFCGIFDGHGPWGHFVSKQVRNSMPISLLCNWQETLSQTTLVEPETDQRFAIWKHLYLKTCADVDQELQHHRKIDTFNNSNYVELNWDDKHPVGDLKSGEIRVKTVWIFFSISIFFIISFANVIWLATRGLTVYEVQWSPISLKKIQAHYINRLVGLL